MPWISQNDFKKYQMNPKWITQSRFTQCVLKSLKTAFVFVRFRSTSCSLPSASCQMLQQKVKSHKTCALSACVGVGWGWKFGACICIYEWFVLICDVWWWCWLHCHKSGPSDVVCRSHKRQAQDLRLENMRLGTYSTRAWRKTLTTFDIWGVELSPGWAPSINLSKLESSEWQIWTRFYMQKKRLKPKGTCSLQFLSWCLITLHNFKLLTTPQFGGIRSSQEESDGIVVSAHQFSGLLAVFGLTRWANSLWTATDILVPLKGTYPLRMRHQPECAYASLKKMPLVLRFWDVKLICLIHPDIPDTVCQYAFFEVLDFRIFLAQPVGAETATQAALVTRPMFALRSETFGRSTSQEKLRDGRQTWPNIGKIIYEKKMYTWKLIFKKNCLDILPYPSIVHILVALLYLFPPFLNKKTHKTSRWITVTAFMVLRWIPCRRFCQARDHCDHRILSALDVFVTVFEVWVWGEFSGGKTSNESNPHFKVHK